MARSVAAICVVLIAMASGIDGFVVVAQASPPGQRRAADLSHLLPQALREWPAAVERPRYSPDGNWIAFSSNVDGSLDIYIVGVGTNEVRRLTDWPSYEGGPAWSPDGSAIVFQSNRDGGDDLWIIELATASSRRLTPIEFTEGSPDWSPRGDLITYVSEAAGSWDIWVIRPDGSGARAVTANEGNEYHPKFSPDGARIVFYPTWSGWTDIYTVDVADGALHEILQSEHEDFRPAWSPDGEHIVFASDRGTVDGLWTAPAGGGEPALLMEATVGVDYPDWTPDGSGVIYVEDFHESHLFEVDFGGPAARPVTAGERNAVDRNPDVAPDGAVVALESNRYGNEGNVVLRDSAGGAERRLSSGRINDGTPRFSPDGQRLVYVRSGGDQASAQALVADLKAGGSKLWSELTNVAYPSFCGDAAIVFGWAPVAYVAAFELWYAPEGQAARRVGDHVIERSGMDCSADGSWLVASLHQPADRTGDQPRLVRIDVRTGESTVLTRGEGRHLHPRISADGTQVAYVGETDGGRGAYVVPITGGAAREVVSPTRWVGTLSWSGPQSLVYSAVTRLRRARLVATGADTQDVP